MGFNVCGPHMHVHMYLVAAESAAVASFLWMYDYKKWFGLVITLRASVQVRLDAMGFNVSAPHMHATCLEALDLQPGHSFLDIGSGCGLVTAAAAFLVGIRCLASLV